MDGTVVDGVHVVLWSDAVWVAVAAAAVAAAVGVVVGMQVQRRRMLRWRPVVDGRWRGGRVRVPRGLHTSRGTLLTDEVIEQLAAEAEQGYDVERLRPRSVKPWGEVQVHGPEKEA